MKRKHLIAALAASICLCVSLTACFHEHTWAKATCTEPKTCTECGETEGEPLGHNEGDWETSTVDYVEGTQTLVRSCERCGETIESKEEGIQSFMRDGTFLLSPSDYTERLNENLSGYSMSAVMGDLEGAAATAVTKSGSQIAGMVYLDSSERTLSQSESGDEESFSKIMLIFDDSVDTDDIALISVAVVQTADPTLDFEHARNLASSCLDSSNLTTSGNNVVGSQDYNGVHYAIGYLDGDWIMTVTPA